MAKTELSLFHERTFFFLWLTHISVEGYGKGVVFEKQPTLFKQGQGHLLHTSHSHANLRLMYVFTKAF